MLTQSCNSLRSCGPPTRCNQLASPRAGALVGLKGSRHGVYGNAAAQLAGEPHPIAGKSPAASRRCAAPLRAWPCAAATRLGSARQARPCRSFVQANVKRDPDGYKDEFMLQVRVQASEGYRTQAASAAHSGCPLRGVCGAWADRLLHAPCPQSRCSVLSAWGAGAALCNAGRDAWGPNAARAAPPGRRALPLCSTATTRRASTSSASSPRRRAASLRSSWGLSRRCAASARGRVARLSRAAARCTAAGGPIGRNQPAHAAPEAAAVHGRKRRRRCSCERWCACGALPVACTQPSTRPSAAARHAPPSPPRLLPPWRRSASATRAARRALRPS